MDVLIKHLPGGRVVADIEDGTSRLWTFDESKIECDGIHIPPGEGCQGRTREYRIFLTFAIRFWQLANEADANSKLHADNGVTGKRAWGSPALQTKLRGDSGAEGKASPAVTTALYTVLSQSS